MDIFLVAQDNPHARSLMLKLAEQSRPGAIIPLTDGEMDLYRSDNCQHVGLSLGEGNPNFTELKPGSRYVFVADKNTIIDDIVAAGERLGVEIAVIRTM